MSIKDESKRASGKPPQTAPPLPLVPERQIRDPRVRLLIDFMQANLHRKLSAAVFAREVHLSASQVSRIFRSDTGLTPNDYLIGLRMQRASNLLTTSWLSIKEVMALTGYHNRSHFLEHFKRYFGPTPTEYRKDVQAS